MTVTSPTIERAHGGFVHLVGHQFRADLRCFVRNKQSVVFTVALPVLFLAIYASVFKQQNVAVPGGRINESVYYVPGIIACYQRYSAAHCRTARADSPDCARLEGCGWWLPQVIQSSGRRDFWRSRR